MNNKFWTLPLAGLILAAMACGGTTTATKPANTPEGNTEPETSALFQDDFSDENSGWDTGESDTSSVYYVDGKYVFKVTPTEWFAWANPGQSGLSDIHVEVTAKNTGSASDVSLGIMCNYQDTDNYYYLGISIDGYYAIAKTENAEDTVLSSDESLWETSDLFEAGKSSYKLGADCGNGKLTLYVDGKKIDSVSESGYTGGDVGLFVQTFEQTDAEIQFDDLVVTSLK